MRVTFVRGGACVVVGAALGEGVPLVVEAAVVDGAAVDAGAAVVCGAAVVSGAAVGGGSTGVGGSAVVEGAAGLVGGSAMVGGAALDGGSATGGAPAVVEGSVEAGTHAGSLPGECRIVSTTMTAVATTPAVITSPRVDTWLISQLSSFPATRLHITRGPGRNAVRNRCAASYLRAVAVPSGLTRRCTEKARETRA
ncbi:hypothetical protein BH09ACT8_BH09ACT8_61600 [soil metagenome]